MKTIGLIGGMSWESTLLYYRLLNREVSRRMGGLHSARIVMHSLNFAEVVDGQKAGDWQGLALLLRGAAEGLAAAGADCLLICTNTMHKVANEVASADLPPLLHIADSTGQAIHKGGLRRVALLGTRYTMEQAFYSEHLARLGIECIVPPQGDREEIHRIIFEELCLGDFRKESRQSLQNIITETIVRGAEGVILGCTELSLILGSADVPLPLFDTTELHAMAAAEFALADMPAARMVA